MLKKYCPCVDPRTVWIEEPLESSHRYRVHCGVCHTYVKWGNELELQSLKDRGVEATVKPHGYEPPRNTLDAFFT